MHRSAANAAAALIAGLRVRPYLARVARIALFDPCYLATLRPNDASYAKHVLETLGDDVTLYQGVTLGGTGFACGKRHPTVQDNVTIGSGAKLLGPITIGHGAKIGANTVVIHDAPPNSTVVGNPGHPVRVEGRKPEGPDADWVHLPDPIADAVSRFLKRSGLAERVGQAEVIPEWPALVGAQIAAVTEPRSITPDGTLFVAVRTNAWMNELSLMEPELLRALNGKEGRARIQRIRWQLKRG